MQKGLSFHPQASSAVSHSFPAISLMVKFKLLNGETSQPKLSSSEQSKIHTSKSSLRSQAFQYRAAAEKGYQKENQY